MSLAKNSFLKPSSKRILSLDLGEKQIGCAISDERHIIASPISPISVKNHKLSVSEVRKLVHIYQPFKIIVGIPYLTDGSPTSQTEKYTAFTRKLKKFLKDTEVELIDETLSTWEVKKKFKQLKLKKTSDPINIDSFTAMELLNQYLNINTCSYKP